MNDHRVLGRELELFGSDPLIGAGLPYWLPDGAATRHAVEDYLYELERRHGYRHVNSPPMGKRELYEISGHWANFAADMYPPMRLAARAEAGGPEPSPARSADRAEELVLRPSLCPHHALIYRSRGRSFRDLPLRIAELGGMYRAERSGVLGGLARVRAIQLNDGHTFCAPEQLGAELAGVLALAHRAHRALGVRLAGYRLSLRGDGGGYQGDPGSWDRAQAELRAAVPGLSVVEAPGEAAFYGPKIDMQVVDGAGRESTLATVQVDFVQPERFGLSYVDSGGVRRRPVIVHRSLAGSMERLFAHLIEVHGGAFPAWYAPVQVTVLPVGADAAGAAGTFADALVRAGLRVRVAADGSLGARILHARLTPFVAVLGSRDAAAGTVAVRVRGGGPQPPRPVDEALADLVAACAAPL